MRQTSHYTKSKRAPFSGVHTLCMNKTTLVNQTSLIFSSADSSPHKIVSVLGRMFKAHGWQDTGTVAYTLALELKKNGGRMTIEHAAALISPSFLEHNNVSQMELQEALLGLAQELAKAQNEPPNTTEELIAAAEQLTAAEVEAAEELVAHAKKQANELINKAKERATELMATAELLAHANKEAASKKRAEEEVLAASLIAEAEERARGLLAEAEERAKELVAAAKKRSLA